LVAEDLAEEMLLDSMNGLESGIATARQRYKESKALSEKPSIAGTESAWNPEKIKWEAAQGPQGPYEKSEDVNSLDFKAMLKDLETHKGKLSRDGLFYWLFTDGACVGRKRQKSKT
jgi:hypothetical protein